LLTVTQSETSNCKTCCVISITVNVKVLYLHSSRSVSHRPRPDPVSDPLFLLSILNTDVDFSWGKTAGAWSWSLPLSFELIYAWGYTTVPPPFLCHRTYVSAATLFSIVDKVIAYWTFRRASPAVWCSFVLLARAPGWLQDREHLARGAPEPLSAV